MPGRFGKAALITPIRGLLLPDHAVRDAGGERKLFDMKQGTIEFWIKRLWDDRLSRPPRQVTFLTNGLLPVYSPWKLPLREWAHVAMVWRPYRRDPSVTAVHIYVDGRDEAFYRSTWWEGYSQRPVALPKAAKWLEAFIAKAAPGVSFALDDVRVSSVPRYADLKVEFGGQQTFNPVRFQPPTAPLEFDEHTLLLFRFDGDLRGNSSVVQRGVQGALGTALRLGQQAAMNRPGERRLPE